MSSSIGYSESNRSENEGIEDQESLTPSVNEPDKLIVDVQKRALRIDPFLKIRDTIEYLMGKPEGARVIFLYIFGDEKEKIINLFAEEGINVEVKCSPSIIRNGLPYEYEITVV